KRAQKMAAATFPPRLTSPPSGVTFLRTERQGLLRKTCGIAAALRYAASSPSRYLKRGIRQMKSLKLLAIGGSMALLGACTNLQQCHAPSPGAGRTQLTRA